MTIGEDLAAFINDDTTTADGGDPPQGMVNAAQQRLILSRGWRVLLPVQMVLSFGALIFSLHYAQVLFSGAGVASREGGSGRSATGLASNQAFITAAR